jgi:hypothetical protein
VARAPVPAQVAAPQLPEAIRWVGGSAEYQAVLRQTYRLATVAVEQAAASRRPGSWAVVLDADETVISNLTYQAERARAGLAFSAESWAAWVRRREATPLPGAAAFLDRVHALGGRIAIPLDIRYQKALSLGVMSRELNGHFPAKKDHRWWDRVTADKRHLVLRSNELSNDCQPW